MADIICISECYFETHNSEVRIAGMLGHGSAYSEPRHQIQMSSQLHLPVILPSRKIFLKPIPPNDGCSTDSVEQSEEEQSLCF
jgi:hypothetical protein